MKKIGIFTLNGNNNYGNKLQNYALKKVIESQGFKVYTLWPETFKKRIKRYLLYIFYFVSCKKRRLNFIKFNKRLNLKYLLNKSKFNKYDYVVVGSDQVWNTDFSSFTIDYLLPFCNEQKRIAYAASFGISYINKKYSINFEHELKKFRYISVRENDALNIIKKIDSDLTVEVVLDPTMLLDTEEWKKIMKKPKQNVPEKYILCYHLGELPLNCKYAIEKYSLENNFEIMNILDKKNPFYDCGPSEFLYLVKNASLIVTDSFHSCVFSFLFNKPFLVFERSDENKNMNSRIDTLLEKFRLVNCRFNGQITDENLNHNYTDAYKILEMERQKSKDFLERALNLKK